MYNKKRAADVKVIAEGKQFAKQQMKMDEEADKTRKLDEHLAADGDEVEFSKDDLWSMAAVALTQMQALYNSDENVEQAVEYETFVKLVMNCSIKELYDARAAKKAEEEARQAEEEATQAAEEASPDFPSTPKEDDTLDAAIDSATEAYMNPNGNASASGHASSS